MCATTTATCPHCAETLTYVPGRRTECGNGHTSTIDQLPVPPGADVTSQYHANGRSKVMIRTLCARCQPL